MSKRTNLSKIDGFLDTVADFADWIIWFGLLLALAASVLQQFGVRIPLIPTIAHEPVLYYAGAYWLLTAKFR